MPSTNSRKSVSFITKLRADFPEFAFRKDMTAHWSADTQTVYYESSASPFDKIVLLHELGHAILKHADYDQDIDLLACERAAWQVARKLAPRYGVTIDDSVIQRQLDTYRTWLHARSQCPSCHTTAIQQKDLSYRCLLCAQEWRSNEARQCRLRRYKIEKSS